MILSRIVKCFLDHTAQSGAVHVKLASQTLRRVLVAVWTNLVQCLSLTNYRFGSSESCDSGLGLSKSSVGPGLLVRKQRVS